MSWLVTKWAVTSALVVARGRVRGAYIMPALGRYEAAFDILEAIGFGGPEAHRAGWRA